MSRAARQVAREMADVLTHYPERTITLGRDVLEKWTLLLAPPIKRRSVTKATRARRATKRELDSLCREIAFRRDGQKCRRCGRTDRQLQWCHVYPKGAHPWLRHDMDNVFVACAHCHMNWWHARPEEAMQWWEKEIGPKAMQALRLRAGRPAKASPIAVKFYLRAERKKYA